MRPHTNIGIIGGAANAGISHLALHISTTMRETQPAPDGPAQIPSGFFCARNYYPAHGQPHKEKDNYVPPPAELAAEDLRRMEAAQNKRDRRAAKLAAISKPLYVVKINGGYSGAKPWTAVSIAEATRYTAKAGRARVDKLQSYNMGHPEAALEQLPT